jgi:hypothetical protein
MRVPAVASASAETHGERRDSLRPVPAARARLIKIEYKKAKTCGGVLYLQSFTLRAIQLAGEDFAPDDPPDLIKRLRWLNWLFGFGFIA